MRSKAAEPADRDTGDVFGTVSEERFVLSRRYAMGAGGVRGLLITVLGEYVRPTRQAAPTSAFIDVLGRLGVDEWACRQALMRASKDEWLLSKREGRYTWWRLSPALGRYLEHGAERIFGFTATQPRWDRRWLQVLARVPETNRAARHLLRTRMQWMSFGNPAPGIWVTTRTDRIKEAELALDEAGVREQAQIFLCEHVGGGDLPVLVRQAWNLDEISQAYEEFVAEFSSPSSSDPIVRVTRMVHAWRVLSRLDPALPVELLPEGWIGIRAAKLFQRQRARWEPAATREWARISREAR
ncbi:PaaX family transcriptional regulator [Phytohabitans aurantiacus]|uniref:PaaX family transcriptional regulator n=1 Tax=Phytohabitans aurantiacus TaxID=3016789 RepID=A0ABQ5R404_9ACTN|nr:PaaX family transcriptional regulator C-terminal domain-containing protein [Phytohabitans aurantiacus]GLI01514.1 PaaX family transcriptional regulator [Phytohabitans aurantiacus]